MIGFVPVVPRPELRVTVGADSEVSVAVEFRGETTRGAVLGAEYTDDAGWRNVSDTRSAANGDAEVPDADDTATREGFLDYTVALELYGVAGPNVFTSRVLRLATEETGDPLHRLTLEDRSGVGIAVNLPFIGDTLAYDAVLSERVRELWNHTPEPDPDPDPPPGSDEPFDIVEHDVELGGDALDLAVRLGDPSDPLDWLGADDRTSWYLDVQSGDQVEEFRVFLDGPTTVLDRYWPPSAWVSHPNVAISGEGCNELVWEFDGEWDRVIVPLSCFEGILDGPPTEVHAAATTGWWRNGFIDTVPDGFTLDDAGDDIGAAKDGPVRPEEQATFEGDRTPPPAWAAGGDVPTTGPEAALFPAGFDRFGGLTEQQFMARHWRSSVNDWRYPPNDGADGEIVPNTLQVGDLIDRFGPPDGTFASPAGTTYPARSVPPSSIGREYSVFRVLKPLPPTVRQSTVAAAFEMPGWKHAVHVRRANHQVHRRGLS